MNGNKVEEKNIREIKVSRKCVKNERKERYVFLKG